MGLHATFSSVSSKQESTSSSQLFLALPTPPVLWCSFLDAHAFLCGLCVSPQLQLLGPYLVLL